MNKQGNLFIVAAPSGAGKTSLVRAIVAQLPRFKISISHTTRPPRPGDQHGREYFFVTPQEFQDLVKQGVFLEHAQVFGHYYGTSAKWVQQQLQQGDDVILEIDWQGAQQIRRLMPRAVSIFILPPSIEELRQRLKKRRQDDDATIMVRLKAAQDEIAHCGDFDYLVVNDDFTQALEELKNLLLKVRNGDKVPRKDLSSKLAQLLQKQ